MTMKNSALRVLVEKTSAGDILKRRSIKIRKAHFIENIDNDAGPIFDVNTIDGNTLICLTFYTVDLHALNQALYNGIALELILCQYDDAHEFERWLDNYDEGMFAIFLQRVTIQIISEVKALAQAAQDIHNNEDISDEALRPIIVRMEDYIKIIDILSDRYKLYYAGIIRYDYYEMVKTKIECAKKYSKENWPILFRR